MLEFLVGLCVLFFGGVSYMFTVGLAMNGFRRINDYNTAHGIPTRFGWESAACWPAMLPILMGFKALEAGVQMGNTIQWDPAFALTSGKEPVESKEGKPLGSLVQ